MGHARRVVGHHLSGSVGHRSLLVTRCLTVTRALHDPELPPSPRHYKSLEKVGVASYDTMKWSWGRPFSLGLSWSVWNRRNPDTFVDIAGWAKNNLGRNSLRWLIDVIKFPKSIKTVLNGYAGAVPVTEQSGGGGYTLLWRPWRHVVISGHVTPIAASYEKALSTDTRSHQAAYWQCAQRTLAQR